MTEVVTDVEARIDRLVRMARAVLDRLEQGEKLSAVLPQARAVAELYGAPARVHWLDCEIYGLPCVPFAKQPRETEEEKAGAYLFCELHRAQDVRNLSVEGVLEDWPKDELPDREMVIQHGVGHLERVVERYSPSAPGETSDRALQLGVLHSEHQRILDGVRAQVYEYISKVWFWALQERENLRLLGPDYRIVVDSLDALETDVGQELRAAVSCLSSTNPAEWALAALACRNVVLSLGRALFPLRTGTHRCAMSGKELPLEGEKELNWLTAFIDLHWRKASGKARDEIEGLAKLARSIYETGSRGKRSTELRHGQVQRLVVDTFDFVMRLKEITGLEPLDEAAVTTGE
ncbi:MAG: hypothetical protein ACUVV3_04285 [Dehalococcoidia bacterium]